MTSLPISDDVAATNRARWNALVDANVQYARPRFDLTPESARTLLDLHGITDDLAGRDVLCLAGGGGQQSAAFALLGANVTVFDLSDRQLERDQQAAAHYGLSIRTVQGDMRHLDAFADASFDIVYQPYSINFVPSVVPVFAEVARVCRPGAYYRVECANPFIQMIDPEQDWQGNGYLLRHPYVDGREVTELYSTWTVDDEQGTAREYTGPREFVHSFATLINALAAHGFVILRASEYLQAQNTTAGQTHEPGSWAHFVSVAPPYLMLWTRFRRDAFTQNGHIESSKSA
jgi:ubiquinone/menaquinone biosynthesis C-methylase UbiE